MANTVEIGVNKHDKAGGKRRQPAGTDYGQ